MLVAGLARAPGVKCDWSGARDEMTSGSSRVAPPTAGLHARAAGTTTTARAPIHVLPGHARRTDAAMLLWHF